MSNLSILSLVRHIQSFLAVSAVAAASALAPQSAQAAANGPPRPTVVLVHGAFADGSSWSGVIERLEARGVRAVAVANPLRGIAVASTVGTLFPTGL